ncbi:Fic/DOC family protein [Cochlodiniinecator piscidefendens]|uniref:Fic/DOC family protein n=1 Tax=Cochlodiniinecator piscidefendens TaxID=2715756 RepID=UPI00140BF333|nr:Fic family protein [Cochlodiniinecator piscidefendens]
MRSDTIVLDGETYNILEHANILSKGGSTFLPASHLDNGLAHIERLANSPEAQSQNCETFANMATEILSDLNYAHPFREGNGRTQRAFMEQLAKRTGHDLDFEGITAARNNAASIESHGGDTVKLAAIVSESLKPEEVEARLQAVEQLEGLGVDRQTICI